MVLTFLLAFVPASFAAVDDTSSLFDDEALDLTTFDHLATGFPLDGQHDTADCESCHMGGVFKGLPTKCETCHDGSFATGKDSGHIPTVENCDVCHSPAGFEASAPTTFMDHSVVGGTPCSGCHNGVTAIGKGPNHIPTTAECDACHNVNSWAVTGFDHSAVTNQACFECHNGTTATGKTTDHISTTNLCEACHVTTVWIPVITVDHAQVIGACQECHNGIISSGKIQNHISTTDSCAACHTTVEWNPALRVDHTQVIGTCESCHNGTIAQGKGPNHIPTTESCNICHVTTSWTVGTFDHSAVAGEACISCHNGTNATGKSTNHIETTDLCEACHNTTIWSPVDPLVDHTQVIGTCESCHDGTVATGKGPNHIPTTLACDSCHVTTTWQIAAFDHSLTTETCISCHDGTQATGKSATHFNTTDECQLCHDVTTWLVAPSAVDHAQVIGTCVSCHDGALASGKSANHINTTDVCEACHQPGPIPWIPVANTDVDHAQVVGTCISCHDGVVASGKSVNHINTTDACDACHALGPVPWAPVPQGGVDHAEVLGVCSSCHDNIIATGKGPNHIPTTQECNDCHSTQQWIPAAVDHTPFVNNCITCHDGINASGKGPSHIDSSDVCDACHEKFPALWTPVVSSAVDHTQVNGTCISCHNGTVASGKSASHINSSDQCDACHQPGPTPWTPVASNAVDHAQVIGSCVSCHDGVIASGKSANHINSTDQCDTCHQPGPTPWAPVTPSAVDHTQVIGTCISCHDGVIASGKSANHINTSDACDACHATAPAGWQPVAPSAVDHTQVIGTCASCHNGVVASGKTPNHINTSDACDACHLPGPTPWIPVANNAVDHNEVIGTCSSCHDGVIATGQGPNHIPTTNECDTCHNTQAWLGTTVDHTTFVGNCITCHDGVSASGKGPNHISTSDVCDACHEKFPATWIPVAPAAVDHTQVLGTCVSCHDGVIASGKGANHINTTDACDACHAPGPTPWVPVPQGGVDHAEVLGVCSSCHDGVIATGKGPNHVPTTAECDSCHSTQQWIPAAVDHTPFVNNCITCHDGVTASGKGASHIDTSDICDTCHEKFPAMWTPVASSAVDHTQVNGTCVSCHNGVAASGKSPSHITTTDQCDACHAPGPTPWVPVAPANVDHAQVLGTCASCHDGVIASGKSANHINTSDVCDACHQPGPTPWAPVLATNVDHAQVIGTCISCHDGTIASGKSVNHINSTDVCDACHLPGPTPWIPVANSAVDHNEVLGVCSSCHDNVIAQGKGVNHITTAEECDLCHSTQQWVPAAVDHTPFVNNCDTCHDGVQASGKGPNHINTSNVCDACHEKFPAAWTPVLSNAVDHAQVIGTCVSCHDGAIASGKSANHINTTDVCDACHLPGPTPWIPVATNAVDHNEVLGVCSSCHDNVIAQGKGPTHIQTTLECDQCHTVTAWIPALSGGAPDHSTFVGNCISCHDGVTASGKSANHINSTDQCDACHAVFPATWAPVQPAAVDHTQVIGTCASCHDGTIASGKSPSHINTSDLCDACHLPGPIPWIPVASNAVDHNQVIGVCSSCHDGTTASGKGVNHIPTTDECDVCHSTQQWIPAAVDHTGLVDNCISCHNGVSASGKSANHLPTSDVCEACHAVFPATWAPVAANAVDHTQVVGICSSCHNGTLASGKSANHINTTNTCDACHAPGPTPWAPVANSAVDHAHVIGTCASCHNGTIASGKSPSHISTTDACDACHAVGPTPWTPVATAAVDHAQVLGTCISCHNGTVASGKSPSHINTTDACDACHAVGPTPWIPVANNAVDHNQVLGICSGCHDNVIAQGKGAGHIQTTLECDQCHAVTAWVPALNGGAPDHSTFVGNCITCHEGTTASGKSANHLPTSDACDACHAVFPATWAPVASAAVDHTQVVGICSSCHNGTLASGKSPNHINSSNTCDACHLPGPTPWAPVQASAVDHGHVIGTCASCHNGVIAQGKGPSHITSSDLCEACHQPAPTPWAPVATSAVDHAQVIGSCVSCHNGVVASGKSPSHMSTTDACDACHQPSPTPWAPVAPSAVDHTQTLGTCSSCHDGVTAQGKGAGHVQTTLECDQCHVTTTWLQVTTVDHTNFVNNCITCHDGLTASGKSGAHLPTSDVCDACHQRFPANWTPVASASVDHNEVVGICSSCHNGTLASGKSANHINSTNTCDACHQPGPTPWAPVQASAVDHGNVIGTCASCHNNTIAQGKPGNHPNTTDLCEACHNTPPNTWLPFITPLDHSQVIGSCVSCHNGVLAQGKPGNHPTTTDICEACHNVPPQNWLPFITPLDHNEVLGTCVSCHNGVIAQGKPGNHPNTTDNCDACHNIPPATWLPFITPLDHNEVIGTCVSCHNGTIATGKPGNHPNTSDVCEACHNVPPQNWLPFITPLDHNEVLGTCVSCHNGTIATGKPGNHPNTTDNCDICHNIPPATWLPFISPLDHSQVLGTCVSCHDGGIATGKPGNHPSTTDVCEACHRVPPDTWLPFIAPLDHGQVLGTCVSCHDGTIATGKSANHPNTTDLCEVCHNIPPQTWTQLITPLDHSQVIGTCVSCHDGGIATGKPGNHPNTSDICENCHNVPPTPWTNVAGLFSHADAFDVCSFCHDGGIAQGKNAGHCEPAGECDDCHITSGWLAGNPPDCTPPPPPPVIPPPPPVVPPPPPIGPPPPPPPVIPPPPPVVPPPPPPPVVPPPPPPPPPMGGMGGGGMGGM